ncbi:hypothetical protein FRC06_004797 [Ceratobasidium sp. 370]|nr:hypothetical protein FRC06_004797 [Ceratobasidium sp. 370]
MYASEIFNLAIEVTLTRLTFTEKIIFCFFLRFINCNIIERVEMVVNSRKILSPANDSWFSDKYIENKGKLYKCRRQPNARLLLAFLPAASASTDKLDVQQKDDAQASEDDDDDGDLPIYHIEEPVDTSIEESTPPLYDAEEEVDMADEWTDGSTPSRLGDTHMRTSEEPEPSEQPEQPSSAVRIENYLQRDSHSHEAPRCGENDDVYTETRKPLSHPRQETICEPEAGAKRRVSATPRSPPLVLYYPTKSQYEPVNEAIPVYYEPPNVEEENELPAGRATNCEVSNARIDLQLNIYLG